MKRWGGKSDDAELIQIKNWLKKRYPQYTIYKDWFLTIERETGELTMWPDISDTALKMFPDMIVHHPDFMMVLTPHDHPRPALVIEIDGSIHKTHAKTRTRKRNDNYSFYKIPHLIADKNEFEFGMDVYGYLERELPKYNL